MIPKRVFALGLLSVLAVAPAPILQAQVTAPDSGKCPWKFPFYFSVSASSEAEEVMYGYDQKNGQYDLTIPPGSNPTKGRISMEASIDTAFGQGECSFSGDTLRFSRILESWFDANGSEGSGTELLTILFVHGQDGIKFFKYELDSSGIYHGRTSWSFSKGLDLTNLLYDDSSIICPDSSLKTHSVSVWENSTSTQDLLYQDQTSNIGSDSIKLFGIFRPVELLYPLSVNVSSIIPRVTLRTFPNPFSHSTEITFTTDVASYADVSVVNLLGAEVAQLFSGTLGAGEHRFAWHPAGLPDGAYECIVRQNSQVEKISMVMMR